ncbi:MAG: hypothetical protein KF680_09985 [Cryobacterium sp.]|nr:hypothetical protein [Cryobacterium sp.]
MTRRQGGVRRKAGLSAVAVALAVSISSCSILLGEPYPTSVEAQDIIGVWVDDGGGTWGKPGGQITFHADGTFEAVGFPEHFLRRTDSEQPADGSGTWEIREKIGSSTPRVHLNNDLDAGKHYGTSLSVRGVGSGLRLWAWYDLDRGDYYRLVKQE